MKILKVIMLVSISLFLLQSCHGLRQSPRTSLVTLTVNGSHAAPVRAGSAKAAHVLSSVLPTNLSAIKVTVSASDMTTITTTVPVAGLPNVTITIEVPNGSNRAFLVEGLDLSSLVVYSGQASADLTGAPVSLKINMLAVADTTPPTFSGLTLVSNLTSSSVQLFWSAATDNVTPSNNIVYLIYQSTTPSGENFATPTYTTPAGATSYTVTGLIPGAVYYFVVRAQDAAGNTDVNAVELTGYYLGTYVDVNTGLDQTGCGAPNQPCQTITYALSLPTSTSPPIILVAPGIYSSATSSTAPSETLPLVLKTGTLLLCYGSNFSTVIDDSAGLSSTGIIINDANGSGGTLVEGCQVNTALSAAIDDSGQAMIVSSCTVSGISVGFSFPTTGIQLSAISAVMNSTVIGFLGGDGNGAGIRVAADALISGNTITGNYDGVYIAAGSPYVFNNAITENSNGINVIDGSPTIDANTITNNSNSGIQSTSGAPTLSPVISNNDISGNNSGIGAYYAGAWSISGNTISGSSFVGIEVYGLSSPITGSISGNTIVSNAVGIDMQGGSTVTFPVVNSNSLSCNTTADFNTNALSPIDVTNNAWDNAPPTTATPSVAPCPAGTDICYSGTAPVFTGSTAVPSPCLP